MPIDIETIEELDFVLMHVEESIRNLKRERNRVVPVSKLPTELLCRVFLIVRDSAANDRRKEKLRWIKVEHICHHWREVGLDCAQLWSIADFESVDMGLACVTRSKQAPWCIRVTWLDRRGVEALVQAIRHEKYRLQCIEISSDFYHTWKHRVPSLLAELANDSTPILETLSIQLDVLEEGNRNPGPYNLKSSVLGEEAPKLRHLSLKGLVYPQIWTSSLLSGLTSLTLESWTPSSCTPSQFFDALKNMRSLSVLDIDNLPATLTHFSEISTLQLPNIKELVVRSSFEGCFGMLHHIELPISARLKLIIDLPNLPRDNLNLQLFNKLMDHVNTCWLSDPLSSYSTTSSSSEASKIPSRDDNRIRSVYMSQYDSFRKPVLRSSDSDDRTTFTIHAWFHYIDFAHQRADHVIPCTGRIARDHPPPFTLSIVPPSTQEAAYCGYDLVGPLVAGFPLQSLESVYTDVFDDEQACSVLESIPSLMSISVKDNDNSWGSNTHLFNALHTGDQLNRIRSLSFDGADFGGSLHTSSYENGNSIDWEDFVYFCTSYRTVDGEPLKRLRLTSAINFNQSMLQELSAVVEDVDWDGVVVECIV